MVEAWGVNMVETFVPGYMNCLDESMSIWTNIFTSPGFMFVPHKPWPFGNEYHTICCCTSGIMWGIDLVKGKDSPRAPHIPQGVCGHPGQWLQCPQGHHRVWEEGHFCKCPDQEMTILAQVHLTEFQPQRALSNLNTNG